MSAPRPSFPAPPYRRKLAALREVAHLNGANFLDLLASVYAERRAILADAPLVPPGRDPQALTYAEARDRVAALAGAYRALGLRPGDVVAFITANRTELALAVLGAIRAGLVAVPLNFMLTPPEVSSTLRRSGARILVADSGTAAWHGLAGEEVVILESKLVPLAAQSPPAAPYPVAPTDPALIFFTSGTTGEPKGATIPHRALAHQIRRLAAAGLLLPTPRHQLSLLVMPLAHNGGFMTIIIQLCLAVPSLVLSRFDARSVLECIECERPTMFTGTPAMYRMLLAAGAEGYDLSSIRVWGGGADLFPRELLDRLRGLGGRRWRRPFTMIGYGSAETCGQVTITPPVPVGDRCIGWVLPGFRARIVGPDGRDVPRGQPGELWLRGGSVMSGYWGEADGEAMRDGWFRTGDVVRRGRFGLLYYESRDKDVIKSGGYTIAAREIEEALAAHPAVRQAAAVGMPDPLKGERPVAAVVVSQPVAPEELERWAAERLAAYKRPRRVYVVDHIPLSASFKPRKDAVRAMLASMEGTGVGG